MSTESTKLRVSVIGLGLMGSALADALITNGFTVTVWNRTRAKAEPLEKMGAHLAASVAEAARRSEVVIVCLLGHAATREAVMTDEVGAAMRGKTLVQLSTTSVEEVDELARWAEASDIAFLKGAILVTPDDIRAGRGATLYGGPQHLFNRLRPLLDGLGGQPSFISDRLADTIRTASALYSFLYSALLSFLYGAAICRQSGIPVEIFTRNVIEPFVMGRSLMSYFNSSGRAADTGRYDENIQATTDAWLEGLSPIMADIKALGIDTAILEPLKALLDQTSKDGYGDQDIAAVIETLLHTKHETK